MITAQSRLGHSSITAQVTAQSRLAVTILVTVSSQWAHGEQSRWPIFFSFRRDLDLEFSRSDMDFAISQQKMVRLSRKTNLSIEFWASNVTIRFDLGYNLDLEFAVSQPKMVSLPRNEKQTYRLNSRPQMLPLRLTFAMALTLNSQGQIWNLLYLNQKWS